MAQELVLNDFGQIMKEHSFRSALENSYPFLESALKTMKPEVLIVSSKGVGVLAYLAAKGLWIERPAILLSPIPNPIQDLVDGVSYESEWNDTVNVLRQKLGDKQPIIIAAGSSNDEKMMITDALEDTACGKLVPNTISSFKNCPNWRHIVIPGGDSLLEESGRE